MTTQTDITHRHHHRATRFFWCLLLGATMVSLVGNVVHAILPYIPLVVVQIGAAAVPPIALLCAVEGIGLAVRAGASGRVYTWAVASVAVIGAGAFAMSFMALRDLVHSIGYSYGAAWVFPMIVDVAVAVSALMLVALDDRPARATGARVQAVQAERLQQRVQTVQTSVSVQPDPAQRVQDSELASQMIAAGVTTKPAAIVTAVLAASRDGASINAAAKIAGINHRTAKRIAVAAAVMSA